MSKNNIHPTAVIEPGAEIGNNVTIEPYVIVKENVKIHDNVTLKSHAYIDGNTTIGEGSTIWPSVSIGTQTQDLKFQGETTYVEIGKNCQIREFVTINSSCQEGSVVKIGNHCLIMAYCHVAHNCELGNHVIMANAAMLAGHVIVEDFAIIGGMTPVHQFVRIGAYSMVGGLSRITHDVPPYTLGAGAPYKLGGLNLIGLKRHGFQLKQRQDLTKAFKITYRSGIHLSDAISKLEKEAENSECISRWVNFCKSTKRGLIGLEGVTSEYQDEIEECEQLLEAEIT